ncbi:phosphoglycerate kinase [Treponema sp. R6D11]
MKKTIKDIDVAGKKVLLRCDLNVPLDADKNITDASRIDKALPTIEYLLKKKAKVILMSHLGRPKGEVKPEFSLEPVARYFVDELKLPLNFSKDIIGLDTKQKASELKDGEILLLENLRFDARETANDPGFASSLANLGDIYVNDAFGTAHRAHASTEGVTKYLPSVSGFLMGKEIEMLSKAVLKPKHPYVAIMGGAKVSDKIPLIENLLNVADKIIIGGGMSFTFIKALGGNVGKSLVEEDQLDLSLDILKKAQEKGVKIILPIDVIAGDEFSNDARLEEFPISNIELPFMGMDIGSKTIARFEEELKDAKTVVWNGPMGVFEFSNFANGTNAIAKFLSGLKAITIVGGGDSASAIKKLGLIDKFTHISTGGGASLEFIEGKKLPGVEALMDKEN